MINEVYDLYLFDDNAHTELGVIQILMLVLKQEAVLATRNVKEASVRGKVLLDTSHKEDIVEKRDDLLAFGLDVRIAKC